MKSFLIIVFLTVIVFVHGDSKTLVALDNIHITKIGMCDPSVDYPLKVFHTFTTKGNAPYVASKAYFKVDFDNEADYNVTISLKKTLDTPEFSPLLNLYEENACDAALKYGGDMLIKMQSTIVGIKPGECPIPKGNYTLNEHPLDFSELPLQACPEGILQSKHLITNKKTKEVLLCMIVEAENLSPDE